MENTEILAIYGTEYKEMTKRLLEEAELDSRIPDKECRIGIKPNLVSPSEPSWGATTHPEIVAGIIEYLQERGFKERHAGRLLGRGQDRRYGQTLRIL